MVKQLLLLFPMKTYKNAFKFQIIICIGLFLVACSRQHPLTVTILHTNDTHSQVEELEKGKRDEFCGGYARRLGLIEQERKLDSNLILLDAGDYSQGTPYFNFYHGRVEIDAMNRMGYDAITLGNHEFDYGVDTLATILKSAKFSIVCANYNVKNSPLKDIVKPYMIICRSRVRIGVFGIGINPAGLIAEKNFAPLEYLDPLDAAQKTASLLKNKEHCDVVICLSHQGTHPMNEKQLSDVELAQSTRNIDIIIGGHTHKIVENLYIQNLDGDSVLLAQAGKSGARIGKIMLHLEE